MREEGDQLSSCSKFEVIFALGYILRMNRVLNKVHGFDARLICVGFVDKVALRRVCLLSTSVLMIYASRYVSLGSAGHVARMRKKRDGYKVLVGKV
jgi:hypothetical protein